MHIGVQNLRGKGCEIRALFMKNKVKNDAERSSKS